MSIDIRPTSRPDPHEGKRVVEEYPNQDILWYQVHLRTDNLYEGVNQNPPLLAPDILPDLFDLPMVKQSGGAVNVIQRIVYDTQTGYPYKGSHKDGVMYRQYNSDFFIAIKGFALDMTRQYKNSYASATVSFVDPKIIPYLKNKDYCEVDNDCLIRDSFCGYGSFNKYEEYADIYGCESPPYDLESINAEGMPTFMDEQYDEAMKCNVRAQYSGASCIRQQCKGTGRTLHCISQ